MTRAGALGMGLLALLLALLTLAGGQTFQYSRGWTNGKRAGGAPLAGLLDLEQPPPEDLRAAARCASLLHRARLLSEADEVCGVPCEFLEGLRARRGPQEARPAA